MNFIAPGAFFEGRLHILSKKVDKGKFSSMFTVSGVFVLVCLFWFEILGIKL